MSRRGIRQIILTPSSYESNQTWGEILENLQEELHTDKIELVCRRTRFSEYKPQPIFTITPHPEESIEPEYGPEISLEMRRKNAFELAKARAEYDQKKLETFAKFYQEDQLLEAERQLSLTLTNIGSKVFDIAKPLLGKAAKKGVSALTSRYLPNPK